MRTAMHQELERLLTEPVSSVIDREQNTLNHLLEVCRRRVVLFGAGGLGRQTLSCLRNIGIEPLAFSDNNSLLWGNTVDGVAVLPPNVAASRFGPEALFIVAIWNPRHWYSETSQQLLSLGCEHIIPPSPVYWRFPDVFLPFYTQDLPRKVCAQSGDVLKAADLWTDSQSQREFLQQVRWRLNGEWTFERPGNGESYFPKDIIRLLPEEVLVDCGAFDGDTIQSFLMHRRGDFRMIFAIEPDSHSFTKLECYTSSLAPELKRKISLLNYAVGAERGTVRFASSGGLDAHISEDAGSIVPCAPISELVDLSIRTTYIKMDIEGAEFDALRGARSVIQRDKPIMGICIYHEQRDLWRLPLLMKAMVPEYQMYLRCHEGDGWQTVAYAVPPERAIRN
jgi:FkbM family methyltransferase